MLFDQIALPWSRDYFFPIEREKWQPTLATITVCTLLLLLTNKLWYVDLEKIDLEPVYITYEFDEKFIDTSEKEDERLERETDYYGEHSQVASQVDLMNGLDGDAFIAGEENSQTLELKQDGNAAITNLKESVEAIEDFKEEQVTDVNFEIEEENAGLELQKSDFIKEKYNRKPQLRKTIADIRALPAPVRMSNTCTTKFGKVSFDVEKTDFGAYEQQLLEAISYKIDALAMANNFSFKRSGQISVKYLLNKNGEINNVNVTASSADSFAEMLCKDAVISQSPFRKWTSQMMKKYGDNRVMQITFILN